MNSPHPLTLFIVKQFYDYDGYGAFSTGLATSAGFMVQMLLNHGHRAALVVATDGNSIDRLVTQNKPAEVILEALWATPTKMGQLIKLHPQVKWTVRIHSEVAFLSNEGSAIAWIKALIQLGVKVAFNSEQTYQDFQAIGIAPVYYLPNYYPLRKPRKTCPVAGRLDVGCFGAIRPLKNQLIQAMAAIAYGKSRKVPLYFHMNGVRAEQGGNNNLKNIQALFAGEKNASLVLHTWMNHEPFLELTASMNICMQVSLSETFNIVSADAVSMGVPLVGSAAISWLPVRSQADTRSVASIVEALSIADQTTVVMNSAALEEYIASTVSIWEYWAA